MMNDQKTNRAVDDIHKAVESAIDAGMSPQEFKRYAAESWTEVCRESARNAAVVLLKS